MNTDAHLDRKVLAAVERLGRALRAARQTAATRHDLSVLGVGLIQALTDGRPRRVGDLAAELDVSQPTVSDALATLARHGLVVRERDPADLRSTLIRLTDMGVDIASEISTEIGAILTARTATAAERAITLRVLLGEIARLQDAGIITVNRSCLACRHFQPSNGRSEARCLLLGTVLPDQDLRVDCPEYEPIQASQGARTHRFA